MKVMNQEVKALWVADLRANASLHGTGALGKIVSPTTTLYCCYGRLCEIAVEQGIVERTAKTVPNYDHQFLSYDDCSACIPESVATWSGLGDFDPTVVIDGLEKGLMYHNDHGARSFLKIADAIEKQL